MIFLGMIDNLKTDHVNVLATIQLPGQKLLFSYSGIFYVSVLPHLTDGWGIHILVVAPEHSVCRN